MYTTFTFLVTRYKLKGNKGAREKVLDFFILKSTVYF